MHGFGFFSPSFPSIVPFTIHIIFISHYLIFDYIDLFFPLLFIFLACFESFVPILPDAYILDNCVCLFLTSHCNYYLFIAPPVKSF